MKKNILISLVLFLGVLAFFLFISPIQLTIFNHDNLNGPPEVRLRGVGRALVNYYQPDSEEIIITNKSEVQAGLENNLVISMPTAKIGVNIDEKSNLINLTGWSKENNTYTSKVNAATIKIQGSVFGDLNFIVSGSGVISVQRGNYYKEYALVNGVKLQEVSIPSKLSTYTLLSPYLGRAFNFEFNNLGARDIVQIRIGQKVIYEKKFREIKSEQAYLSSSKILFSCISNLKALFTLIFCCLTVLFLALNIGQFMTLVGARSARPDYNTTIFAKQTAFLTLIIGIFVAASLISYLSYLLPLKQLYLWLLLIIPIGCFVLNDKKFLTLNTKLIFEDFLKVLPAVAFSFWPVIYWGYWFLGKLQTDMYEYLSLSEAVKEVSLFNFKNSNDIQNSGVLTAGAGTIWRSIDSIVVSALARSFNMPMRFGFVLLSMLALVLFAFAVINFIRYCAKDSRKLRDVFYVIPLFLPLTAIYTEGYLSQYVATSVLLVFLTASYFALKSIEDSHGKVNVKDLNILAAASSGAFCLALYPYFTAPIILAISLYFSKSFFQNIIKFIPIIFKASFVMLLLLGFNILTIINFGKTSTYNDGLDLIAKNLVFPFLYSHEFLARLIGIIPFHFRTSDIDTLASELPKITPYLAFLRNLFEYSYFHLLAQSLFIILLLIVVFKTYSSKSNKNLFYYLLLNILVLSAFILYFFLTNQAYVFAKFSWTASILIFWLLYLMTFLEKTSENTFLRRGLNFYLLILFPLFWMVGSFIDRLPFFLSPYGVANHRSHVGLIADLEKIDDKLEELSNASNQELSFNIFKGTEKLYGTDRDRVLLVHTRGLLSDHGIRCENCVGHIIPEGDYCKIGNVITIGKVAGEGNCFASSTMATTHVDIKH